MKAILEPIYNDGKSSLTIEDYELDNFGVHWHFHPQFEIVYILEGEGTRYVGNSIEEFHSGDFVILANNLPHHFKVSKNYNGKCRAVVIKWLEDVLLTTPEFKPLVAFLESAHQGIKFSNKTSKAFKQRVKDVVDDNLLDSYLAFINLLNQLLKESDYRLLCTDRHEYKLDQTTSDRLSKVYEYVETNYQEKINLIDISQEVGMTSESFSRFFSNSMNKSFFTFLNDYRINKACKMLVETSEPITAVCTSCGFESPSFFHKQFRKVKELTPLKFRKLFLDSDEEF